MEENKEKKVSKLSLFANKASEVGKKTAEGMKKFAKGVSEKSKQMHHDSQIKKYNPLFKEDFENEDFKLPNVIEIVDDAVRRDIKVCEGSIGWTDKVCGVEILYLYDEWVKDSKIQFVPFAKCDAVYCMDIFDKNKFIEASSVFERVNNEKIAELEHIANYLGAKRCAVEVVCVDTKKDSLQTKIDVKVGDPSVNSESAGIVESKNEQRGKKISNFKGNDEPKKPHLKWFTYDDNIKNLIKTRLSGNNQVTYQKLELSCTTVAAMSYKTACAIDKLSGVKAAVSMERKSIKERSSKLVFEIEF